jgi:hypothetical protein
METCLRTRLRRQYGVSNRSLGIYEGKKKVVAFTDDHRIVVYRSSDCDVERIGSCPVYLHTVLRDHYD